MHKNSTPNLARSVGEIAVTETSSKFNMKFSVTDANIFSVNGKEL